MIGTPGMAHKFRSRGDDEVDQIPRDQAQVPVVVVRRWLAIAQPHHPEAEGNSGRKTQRTRLLRFWRAQDRRPDHWLGRVVGSAACRGVTTGIMA